MSAGRSNLPTAATSAWKQQKHPHPLQIDRWQPLRPRLVAAQASCNTTNWRSAEQQVEPPPTPTTAPSTMATPDAAARSRHGPPPTQETAGGPRLFRNRARRHCGRSWRLRRQGRRAGEGLAAARVPVPVPPKGRNMGGGNPSNSMIYMIIIFQLICLMLLLLGNRGRGLLFH
jgi:hypothetical protein